MEKKGVHVKSSAGRCAYCHDGVAADERVACAACLAVHHHDCWEERCAACGATDALRRSAGGPEGGGPGLDELLRAGAAELERTFGKRKHRWREKAGKALRRLDRRTPAWERLTEKAARKLGKKAAKAVLALGALALVGGVFLVGLLVLLAVLAVFVG